MLGAYGDMYSGARDRASDATSGFFGDLGEFFNDYGGRIGSWFGPSNNDRDRMSAIDRARSAGTFRGFGR